MGAREGKKVKWGVPIKGDGVDHGVQAGFGRYQVVQNVQIPVDGNFVQHIESRGLQLMRPLPTVPRQLKRLVA